MPSVGSGLERPERGDVVPARRVVVTALPLRRRARDRLADRLGARVVDIREPVDAADVVLTPACSPQLIGALGRRFPGARIVVVELDDWELDIELGGPVKRILRGGADAYVLADSIDELADKLVSSSSTSADDSLVEVPARELPPSSTVDELIAAFLRESVEYSVRHRPRS